MPHCVNHNHFEIKELSEKLNLHKAIVSSQVALWQEQTGIMDRFPTVEEYNSFVPEKFHVPISEVIVDQKLFALKKDNNNYDFKKLIVSDINSIGKRRAGANIISHAGSKYFVARGAKPKSAKDVNATERFHKKILEKIRDQYKEKYGFDVFYIADKSGASHEVVFYDLALSRISNDDIRLGQLKQKNPQKPNLEKLDTLLTQKLTDLGVSVEQYNQFKKDYDVDAVAMLEIINGVAKIKIDFSNANELTLPEETAHFILEAMADSALTKRLLGMIEADDYYKTILGNNFDAYNKSYKGDKTLLVKEAAGQLLSQAIVSKFKGENFVVSDAQLSLLQRIWNYFKDLIKRIDRTELNKSLADAYGNVARDFLDGNLKFMEAINIKKNITLFEISDSALNRLKTKIETARDASAKRYKIYDKKGIKRTADLEKIALEELKKTIEDKDYLASALSIAESSRHMYTHVTKRLNELEQSIKKIDTVGVDALLSLSSVLKGMKSFNDSYLPMLKNIETEVYGLLVDEPNNEDYKKILDIVGEVRRKAEYVQDRYLDIARPIFTKYVMPFIAGGPLTEDNLIEALKNSGEDITFMSRFTDSMAMSGKPIMQVIDILVKHAKQEAKDESYDAIKDLISAHMEMEKFGVKNTKFMYEIGKDGKLTGNVVTKYNQGDYAAAKKKAGDEILNTIRTSNKGVKFSDDVSEFMDEIQGNEVLLNQFKKLWGNWYVNNNEPIDDLDERIAEMQAKLGKDEYDDWFFENTTYYGDGSLAGYKNELSRPSDKYLNKQYSDIQGNSVMKKYYDIAMDLKESHDNKLSQNRRLGNLAPQVRNDAIQKIKKSGSLSDLWTNIKSYAKENFTNVEDDTELGDRFKITDENDRPVYFLPIHFTGRLNDVNDLSTDFTESLAMFINKSNDFNKMNKIIDMLEIGHDLVEAADVLEYDSNGNIIKQSINLIGNKIIKAVKADTSASNIKARTDAYFKMVVYGQARSEGKDFTFLGQKVNSEKLLDLFGRYTSLGTLAMNLYAGIQNPLIGNANIRIEAVAKQHIDHKDLLFADGRYLKDLPMNLANVGARNPTDFMTLFGEKMEVMQDFSRKVGELDMEERTKLERAMSTNSLYITSSGGEHQLQYRLAYALAHAKKLKDSSGKEITLIDAFDIVGNKMTLKKGLKNLDGTDFNEMSLRAHKFKQNAINNAMHGIYNDIDLIVMQQYGILRHALMFRKFIRPGYNRRWRKKMFDLERQTVIEGYYRTYNRFWKNVIYQNKKLQWEFAANWNKLEDWEKQNFRRATADIGYIVALNTLIWFILPLLGGDDEDEWAANMASYQINRMLTEITFFIDPRQVVTMIKSPTASLDQINRNINLVMTFANPWFAAEEIQQGRWKGYSRGEKALVTTLPLYKSLLDWTAPENKLIYQRLNNK